MAEASTSRQRIAALDQRFEELLTEAADQYDRRKLAAAAYAAEQARKIAGELQDIERRLGNLCSDHRLLEWKR